MPDWALDRDPGQRRQHQENFSYTYDVLGNVLTRADANEDLTETFTYEALNRVTWSDGEPEHWAGEDLRYDAIGNLLSKSDVWVTGRAMFCSRLGNNRATPLAPANIALRRVVEGRPRQRIGAGRITPKASESHD